MSDVLGYAGTRCLVSGAASGMGRAVAELLVDLGADVTGMDIRACDVPGVRSIEVDLRDESSIDAAIGSVDGPLDAVFAVAGLPGAPHSDQDVVTVNFIGGRHLVEATLPLMAPGSAITWVSSTAAFGWQGMLDQLRPFVETAGFTEALRWCDEHPSEVADAYILSKRSVNAYVAVSAKRFVAAGVRLNTLNPGPTDSPMMVDFERNAGRQLVAAATGPIGRYSTVEEQAWPMVFLNSPRSSYLAGTSLFADGGFEAALLSGQLDFSEFED